MIVSKCLIKVVYSDLFKILLIGIGSMNNKIIAFDFLRALAIIMIIPAHLSNFLFSIYSKLGLYAFDPYFANMGLGLFIFISGYLLYYNNHSINSLQSLLSFYKKRLFRIFPLYWTALVAYIVVFSVFAQKLNTSFVFPHADSAFGHFNILIHILGLQIFLAPAYASPMLTLYFIGLIIAFYTLYPFIIMFSKDARYILLNSFLIFIVFLLLSRTFSIIDSRFFMFFPVFVFGILTCKESLFEKSEIEILKKPVIRIILAVLPVIFVLIIVLESRTLLFLDPKVYFTINSVGIGTIKSSMIVAMLDNWADSLNLNYATLQFILDTLLLNIFVIIFCIFEYRFATKFINDNFSSALSSIFTYIATSSYCVYLFHRPFFVLWNSGTNFIHNYILHDIVIIFISLPILFFVSYNIQILESNLRKNF
jgi:peptidoglycan/LPS O-acetylase OafA/YrhL